MFTHLDDPEPHTATTGWHRAVHRRVRTRRRRRAGLAAGGVFTVATVAAGAGLALDRRLQPERVEVQELAEAPPDGEAVTLLFVGLDRTRELGTGEVSDPAFADTIVIARVEPATGQVRLLPVPRDLWLAGPGVRINTSVAHWGPRGLVDAVRDELGIEVHHYVQADLDGALAILDALGGIRLSVPHRVTSARAGVDLAPGCQVLTGGQVSGLSRALRDLRVHDPAAGPEGRLDPGSDVGRQQRNAVVATALLQAVGRVGIEDLPALVDAGLRAVAVDHSLDRDDLVDLGRVVADAEVVTYALPVEEAVVAENHVLLLTDDAGPLVSAFLDGTPPPVPSGPDAPGAAGPLAGDATGLAVC